MNRLVVPTPLFRQLLAGLSGRSHPLAVMPVGMQEGPSGCAYLARPFVFADAQSSGPEAGPHVQVTAHETSWPPVFVDWPSSTVGRLALGRGRLQGLLWCGTRREETRQSFQRLVLVGEGMHSISPEDEKSPARLPGNPRWSRTSGALGGEEVWQRLVRLSVALIGCGRTGSLVASSLVRLGFSRVALIDPDILERHNLGEMDLVGESDLGRPKGEALAEHLYRMAETAEGVSLQVNCLTTSVTALSARLACQEADVLFCCADNDAARLATAIVATLYHKVLIDIGTGIFSAEVSARSGGRSMGADVRLILPGDGCLLCRGNLADYAQAVDDLAHYRTAPASQVPWQERRAGSLRTLNQLAASLGVQMLQDLVGERIRASLWAHAQFEETGRLTVAYPSFPSSGTSPCPLCAKSGLGDGGLGWR